MNKVTFMRRCAALSAVPNSGGYKKMKDEVTKGKETFEGEDSEKNLEINSSTPGKLTRNK